MTDDINVQVHLEHPDGSSSEIKGRVGFSPMQGPGHTWKIGKTTISIVKGPRGYRWEGVRHGCGSGGHRTPLGAYIGAIRHSRRTQREHPGFKVFPE